MDEYHKFFVHKELLFTLSKEDQESPFAIHTSVALAGKWYIILSVNLIVNKDGTTERHYHCIKESSSDD